MALLADKFRDDKTRAKAMSYAFIGLGLGTVLGHPFGGFMYEFFDKTAPFLVICAFVLLDGCGYDNIQSCLILRIIFYCYTLIFSGILLFMIQKDYNGKAKIKPPSLIALVGDPYILLAAGK